ncbi:MAG: toll/interleukin-1 receptor domain-containing protein, partial [Clostridia bacterium]|nr:toll/interleukin-1 receptor domain-containing protein [Clostridia bacterium]
MSVFKCKMCGGTVEFNEGENIGVCDSCGTRQTFTKSRDEIVTNLFNRANNLRMKSEFDKAAEVYEKILETDNTDSEAHWGIVLCKYGIEYVDDPGTGKKIPTCHRAHYDSILTDPDYLAALENADTLQQGIYTAQALEISAIQKGILDIVKQENPFDVFICYKETDENGKRTVDSALANDIYYQLTKEGLKVFYAAITLEDKLGREYEPYIFAALNSAKVMLVIGTKPEYFEAIWVKNEWSRFLKIIEKDRSKLLIPCYRDMDAYDLPEEFAHLQAQDMGKIGFINDVVRGIKKITQKEESIKDNASVAASENSQAASPKIDSLLNRAFMFIEDGDFKKADEYLERVLDINPQCSDAYYGKLM